MNTNEIPVAVVGLGLMGSSIATCLLIAGHPVVALAPLSSDLLFAKKRIIDHLEKAVKKGIIPHTPDFYLANLLKQKIIQNYLNPN